MAIADAALINKISPRNAMLWPASASTRRGSTSFTVWLAPTEPGPGLREALAACRDDETLVVTKLDRLARSLPDAGDVVDKLTGRGVKLNIGGSVHDPNDPIGRLLIDVHAMIAEFEADLARLRTREGMKVAKAKGRLRGKPPKLRPAQEAHLVELWHASNPSNARQASRQQALAACFLKARADSVSSLLFLSSLTPIWGLAGT